MDENGKPQTPAEIRTWAKAQRAEANAEVVEAVDGVRADMSAATVKLHEDLDSAKRDRQAQKDARAAAK